MTWTGNIGARRVRMTPIRVIFVWSSIVHAVTSSRKMRGLSGFVWFMCAPLEHGVSCSRDVTLKVRRNRSYESVSGRQDALLARLASTT